MISEEFLHHVWQFKLFNTNNLKTIQNEEVKIVQSGIQNTDAGPDFFNAKLQISETLWAGNVEIHTKSSDWIKHQHQLDKTYDNIILHVVYEDDQPITDKSGNFISTIELKNKIGASLIENYHDLLNSKSWIPCENQIKNVDEFIINSWINRLIVERLERKSGEIKETLELNKNDWEETFYQYLFKYFGLTVNALPFHLLAKQTPLRILEKHNSLLSIESLLYGQAGMLEEDMQDTYYQSLREEYQFLKNKFSLEAIDKSLWKLLRLRPSNFPTIRISQLSNLLVKAPRIFSKVVGVSSIKELQSLFDVSASHYWDNHYQFGNKVDKKQVKKLGKTTINNIIINVVVPLLFIYSKENKTDDAGNEVFNYLEILPSEVNTIVKRWNELGVKTTNALQSQALLELKNNYCFQKKCLNCSIGNNLLKNDK